MTPQGVRNAGQPSPDRERALEGVKAGDSVYIGRGGDLRPHTVDSVSKRAIVCGPNKYNIQSGRFMGGDGWTRNYAHKETPDLKAAEDLRQLRNTFERELTLWRGKPENMTREPILRVLRALNPEAWAVCTGCINPGAKGGRCSAIRVDCPIHADAHPGTRIIPPDNLPPGGIP